MRKYDRETHTTKFRCDACGEVAVCCSPPRVDGWVRFEGKDFCPAHRLGLHLLVDGEPFLHLEESPKYPGSWKRMKQQPKAARAAARKIKAQATATH